MGTDGEDLFFEEFDDAATHRGVAEGLDRDEFYGAVATLRWTGSWHTVFITVDRKGGRPVSAAFEADLRQFLEKYRLAGHDLEIDAPRYVPLDLSLTVCLKPGYTQSAYR